MDIEQIKTLLQLVAESGVAEVELEDDEFRMVVRTVPQHVAPPAGIPPTPVYAAPPLAPATTAPVAAPSAEAVSEPAQPSGIEVKAPIVGTYYSASSPDSDPFVSVGDTVKKGDVLCIIEAMKLMNEIESEVSGVVTKILVDNAQPVQYDEPLFIVDPS